MKNDDELDDDALEEYRLELCRQADFWGMESLTEDQQVIVENKKQIGKD